MFFFAAMFIMDEGKQLKEAGASYFLSPWNYIDMVPLLLITAVSLNYLLSDTGYGEETLFMALSSLMMWFKLLGFLRLQKDFAYMIKILLSVGQDSATFMVILALTLMAFTDAMYTISRAMPADSAYFDEYYQAVITQYLLALGEFNTDDFDDSPYPSLSWVIFLSATLVNCITMLNLLIAVVSETFAAVVEH